MRYGCYEYSDLPSSYQNQAVCGLCENIKPNDYKEDYYGKKRYYCKEKCEYRKLDEGICRDVLISRSNYDKLGSYSPSGCYITTIICEILGYDDNCEVLNVLRNFRDKYLKLNLDKYLGILQQYDFIGPIISEGLRNLEDKEKFSLMLLKNYLIPCTKEIKNNNYEMAILIYKEMVMLLIDKFNITLTLGDNIPYNFEDLGKGRILRKESTI